MIDVAKFESIVKKVDTLKATMAKAQGAVEAAEKQLAELGVTDMDTIDAVLEKKQALLDELDESIDAEFEELKGLYAWQFV
jgi:hypothetical protein